MKKLFLLALCSLFAIPAYAAAEQDGLLTRLRARVARIQARQEKQPAAQWKRFLSRQHLTPGLIQQRNRHIALVRTFVQNPRRLENAVPVSRKTAFLLRLARGEGAIPPQLDHTRQKALREQAAETKKYIQKKLLTRYNHLQQCINQHPQLAGYTLYPSPELLFARDTFPYAYGTATAYQTAEKMFCSLHFGESLSSRQAQTELKPSSLSVRFPSVKNPSRVLEAVLDEQTHFITLRFALTR